VLPKTVDIGGPWKVLPPGIHDATMDGIKTRYATNPHRNLLFQGLVAAVAALRAAGCKDIYLNGSFVTEKPQPSDFDGCWDPTGVDDQNLDPVLLNFENKRANQKKKYLGELFLSSGWPHRATRS
jgi:Family of unknown function (DUF6932)